MRKLKFSLIALFIFAGLSASAQVSFGVKGGLNISAMNVNKTKPVEGEKSYVKAGFNIGLTADYMFNENMGVQSGLSFTTLGAIKKQTIDMTGEEKFKLKASTNFNALQVPIHFAYKMNFTENCNITLHGGPYASYILSGKTTISGNKDKNSITSDLYGKDSQPKLKKFDAGLGFGVAFGYNNCYVDLGYDMGLVNLHKFNKEQKEAIKTAKIDTPYLKTMNIYLSVGYKF